MVKPMDWASDISISCVGSWVSVGLIEVNVYKVLESHVGEDSPLGEVGTRLHEPSPSPSPE